METEKRKPTIFDGVKRPTKKSYAEYAFLFRRSHEYGDWKKTKNVQEENDDDDEFLQSE